MVQDKPHSDTVQIPQWYRTDHTVVQDIRSQTPQSYRTDLTVVQDGPHSGTGQTPQWYRADPILYLIILILLYWFTGMYIHLHTYSVL